MYNIMYIYIDAYLKKTKCTRVWEAAYFGVSSLLLLCCGYYTIILSYTYLPTMEMPKRCEVLFLF